MTTPQHELTAPRDGFVYVLSNPHMAGLVKVGCTERHPKLRAFELSNATGVAAPFRLELFFDVTDRYAAERVVHDVLKPYRETQNREFFAVRLQELVPRLVESLQRLRPMAALTPGICPDCGVQVTEAEVCGLWDGVPDPLRPPGGPVLTTVCSGCGAHLEAAAWVGAEAAHSFWYRLETPAEGPSMG